MSFWQGSVDLFPLYGVSPDYWSHYMSTRCGYYWYGTFSEHHRKVEHVYYF